MKIKFNYWTCFQGIQKQSQQRVYDIRLFADCHMESEKYYKFYGAAYQI